MKDQVVMSKTNGQLAVAVPLYRYHYEEPIASLEGYTVAITNAKPLAFVLDCDAHGCQLINADFAYANLEFLGDL